MRAVVQRVTEAWVSVEREEVGRIGAGVLILLGVAKTDKTNDADYLAAKIANLRIFDDQDGKLNDSLLAVKGSALVVSQFTLYGDCRKGRRPSYDDAAPGPVARELYEYFIKALRREKIPVASGIFQASMSVHLTNDGPVTLIVDSPTQRITE
jgi:D-tyrosyl-tRNA(Tyr) deacylase